MKTKISNHLIASVLCVLALSLFTACGNGGASASPSPEVTTSAEPTPAVSLEVTPSGESAPGAVTEATPPPENSPSAGTNTPSPQVEEAAKIRSTAKNIKEVEDVAVVVTGEKKCVAALKLKSGTALDTGMKNQIQAAANKDTEVKVTADSALYEEVKKIEEDMLSNLPLSMDKVNAVWNKIN